MEVIQITTPDEESLYEKWINNHPHNSLWQSLNWKKYQQALGREVRIYTVKDNGAITCSALVIADRTAFNLSAWDIPRGPLWKDNAIKNGLHLLLNKIKKDAKKDRCLAIYSSAFAEMMDVENFKTKTSHRHLYPRATRIINLKLSPDELLAQMKPKGRYNIKVARKHEVEVKISNDAGAFLKLAGLTASRDGFCLPPADHLKAFLNNLEGSFLLLATDKTSSEPMAGLIGVIYGNTGIYYYGASSYAFRAQMAPYLLQWRAIEYCRFKGCTGYDLLGIAPPQADENHPWQKISRFKEKFGGRVVLYPPEKQLILKPVLKKLIEIKRSCFH